MIKFFPIDRKYCEDDICLRVTESSLDATDKRLASRDMDDLENAMMSAVRDNKRAYIQLCVPVMNYTLSRSSASLAARILGISQKDCKDIISFKKVYSKSKDKLILATSCEDPDDALIYAQIFEKYIKDFDVEKRIKEEYIYRIQTRFCQKDEKGEYPHIGDITREESPYLLPGGWYFHPYNNWGHADEVSDYIIDDVLSSGDSTLMYLLNMKDTSVINGFIRKEIVVLPVGLRPAIQGMKSPYTAKYMAILTANRMMAQVTDDGYSMSTILLRYKSLDNKVQDLVFKPQTKQDEKKAPVKTIEQMFIGKKAIPRGKLLSKRTDYCARGPIIINPKLSVAQCGIPESMIPKIYRYHYLKASPRTNLSTIKDMSDKEMTSRIKKLGILDKIPCCLNRAPTLHNLSYLAYNTVVARADAIELHPLACSGFNADFDGDTMAAHVPLGPNAVNDVMNLLLTSHNLFVPASGKLTIVPRQEMVYGLNIASKFSYEIGASVGTFESLEAVKQAIEKRKVKVWDTVTINGKKYIAGHAAIQACMTIDAMGAVTGKLGHLRFESMLTKEAKDVLKSDNPGLLDNKVVEINKKSVGEYSEVLLEQGIPTFIKGTDNLVQFGFLLAKLYAPSITLLTDFKDDFIKDPFKEFHQNMAKTIELYELGLESNDSYNATFEAELDKVKTKVLKKMEEVLGAENGFYRFVKSGARGTEDNLLQIYFYKGRIAKTSNTAFNAVIEESFMDQLSPLAHFTSAYGARKGMTDKTQKTGDTGYGERLMTHTAIDMWISEKDCGTTDGLVIAKHDLERYIEEGPDQKKDIANSFKDIITGRYIADSDDLMTGIIDAGIDSMIKLYSEKELSGDFSKQEDRKLAESKKKTIATIKKGLSLSDGLITPKIADLIESVSDGVKIRAVSKCKNPCCAKCYGIDLSIRGYAAVGTPIGAVAAASIGEPGTQLTMKTFHKGGVASKSDVTSDWDRFSNYLHVTDLSKKPNYDPIAWANGDVEIKQGKAGTIVVKIKGHKKKITLPEGAQLKPVAVKGEGLCLVPGDHNVEELRRYAGDEAAEKYLLYSMYFIYKGKADINFKHFEVLVASMHVYLVVATDRPDLKVGMFYSRHDLLRGYGQNVQTTNYEYQYNDVDNCDAQVVSRFKPVKSLQLLKESAMNNIMMEQFAKGISKAVLLGGGDPLVSPISRMSLSKRPYGGSSIPGYIEERTANELTFKEVL